MFDFFNIDKNNINSWLYYAKKNNVLFIKEHTCVHKNNLYGGISI